MAPQPRWKDQQVRFEAEHHFPAPAHDVYDVVLDPAFHLHLELPDLSSPEGIEQTTDGEGGSARLVLRYEFVGQLDAMARRLLAGRRLTWRQDLAIDRARGTGTLTFGAEADPDRLHGQADLVFTDEGGGTHRRIDGELVVGVPVVRRMAEARIVPGLLRRLDIEAQAVRERLTR
jgi:hypothetical protein